MRHVGLQIMSFWRVRHVNVHLAQVRSPANGRFVPLKLIEHNVPKDEHEDQKHRFPLLKCNTKGSMFGVRNLQGNTSRVD